MSDSIVVEEYTETHAKSIAEHLFGDVPEEVVRSQREELLMPGPDEVYSVCALLGNDVVGICTGVRMRWYGSRHRIEMIQVVVGKEFRGQGIARLMMMKIAEHFVLYGVEIVQISAESRNATAIAAYEQLGFTQFGILKDGINHDGNYSDEIMMAIPINKLMKN